MYEGSSGGNNVQIYQSGNGESNDLDGTSGTTAASTLLKVLPTAISSILALYL